MATFDSENHHGHHKRTKSSVLKTLMGTRNHKRNPSAGDALPSGIPDENRDPRANSQAPKRLPLLPHDHPHAFQRPLGELVQNQLGDARQSSKQLAARYEERLMVKSQIFEDSKVLPRPGLQERGRQLSAKDDRQTGADKRSTPKKSKSQTSLSALLSRPKSSKGISQEAKGKERKDERIWSPDRSGGAAAPPIYAQFASQPLVEAPRITTVPLNDSKVNQEIRQYTPANYSPSKQRNFHDHHEPTLGRPTRAQKPRPKSEYLTSSTTSSALKNALSGMRRSSNESSPPPAAGRDSSEQKPRPNSFWGGRNTAEKGNPSRKSSNEFSNPKGDGDKVPQSVFKRTSRVMAAVATFNMKAKEAQADMRLDPKAIEASFETLLDSRNIPQNMRQKLRSLDTRIKADFIKQDNAASSSHPMMAAFTPGSSGGQIPAGTAERSMAASQSFMGNAMPGTPRAPADDVGSESPSKRARPRSRTFTLSRGDKDASPTKKPKPDGGNSSERAKSSDRSSRSLTSTGAADAMALGFGHKPQPPIPQDFVAYLKDVQDPREVEVGRLHKLRLVLRNERVAWVDSFISMGGMAEVISLLHRIMAIEWREEHEDALLHEALLCLKALCTTALALRELHGIQATLFPALLKMLFDEERKGPSEFTTRGIIINLLVMYLADASTDELAQRARVILSYIRDPVPREEEKPLGFIVSMHQPRPYRVWCREIVSVTKEVFWIFLHNVNIIPIIPPDTTGTSSYPQTHFPRERPPVPAAPYVGGVEWDATNYLSAHLDLLNGLIASLPSTTERNALRRDLQLSGFERIMGGSLRTCKEKFYGSVHDGLKTWVAAAYADEWPVQDVRMGPPAEERKKMRSHSPVKKKAAADMVAPQVELPKLDLDVGVGVGVGVGGEGGGGEKWVY